MNPELETITNTLLVIVIGIFVIVLLVGVTMKINHFSRDLNHINTEIARTNGSEREYWKREKRRLWLSLLPFYRR